MLDFVCTSMLEHDCSDATRVFCFNMCLSKPFLSRMERHLLAQLPTGACVLLHGLGFPTDCAAPAGGSVAVAGRRLELQLRHTMWYGYRVVADGAAATAIKRPRLKRDVQRLGSTRFERVLLVDAG